MSFDDVIAKIKLPTGTVGKICLMLIALSLSIATMVVAVRVAWVAALAIITLAIVVLVLGIGVIWFANKHPQAALMEGFEFLKYEQTVKSKFTPSRVIVAGDKTEKEKPRIAEDASKALAQPDKEEKDG